MKTYTVTIDITDIDAASHEEAARLAVEWIRSTAYPVNCEVWGEDDQAPMMIAVGSGATIEFCPKCGARTMRAKAYVDHGTGEEAGRVFYYCSERCRETH